MTDGETTSQDTPLSAFSFEELAKFKQGVAEVYKTALELPSLEEVETALAIETNQRVLKVAQGVGILAVSEAGSEEHERGMKLFQEGMESLGLSHLLIQSAKGELREQLRSERIRRGLTQAQVAEQMGVSVAYVSRMESGNRNSEVTKARIIDFLSNHGFDSIRPE